MTTTDDREAGLCPFCVRYGWDFDKAACVLCGEGAEVQ